MEKLTRPAWVEINLDNLVHNYQQIRNITSPDTEVMAVVKADAYSLGDVPVVKALKKQGVRRFAVAILSEANHIKKYVDDIEILILGYIPDYLLEKAIKNDFILTIYNEKTAIMISEVAQKFNKIAKVHLKIETGMNRLGFIPGNETVEIIKRISEFKNIFIEGIYTHFAVADEDMSYTFEQVDRFNAVVRRLEDVGVNIPLKHVKNSAGIVNLNEYDFDLVRPGAILYGIKIYPDINPNGNRLDFKAPLTLKANVSNVKVISEGEKISYGLIFEAKQETTIATVPIGYADGYNRLLSNIGRCIVNDKVVTVAGRVCMDQLMLDVTGVDVKIGDEVILLGPGADKEISLEEVGNQVGDIPYAVLCAINKRLPRIYIEKGEVVEIIDYLDRI